MEEKNNKHTYAFIFAGLSFIPLIGVLFGVLTILISLFTRKANSLLLGILGTVGILITIVLYGYILPNSVNSEEFYDNFKSFNQKRMFTLIKSIEYYKLQNNKYPNSINEFRESLKDDLDKSMTFEIVSPNDEPRSYYYKLTNDGKNYMLFSIGKDSIAFTEDDIYPVFDSKTDKNIGWVKGNR